MLIHMKREYYHSLNDSSLPRACFEHIIPLIRGKDLTVKENVYRQLSTGQKALFMFNAYYNHASNSLVEFYWWSCFYLTQPNSWSALLDGFRYFNTESMVQFLIELEEILYEANPMLKFSNYEFSYKDLENNSELNAQINRLYTQFNNISPITLKKISEGIRKNPKEFIQFIDE